MFFFLNPRLAHFTTNNTYIAMMMRWNHSDTDFFNILTGVLQRDILAPFLFIICLDLHTMNVNRSNKKKWSQTKKKAKKKKWYSIETIMDADYADDLALLTNTLVQAECLL